MFKSLLKGPLIIIFALILSFNSQAMTLPDIPVVNQFGVKSTLMEHLKGNGILVLGFYSCKHVCHFMVKNLSRTLSQRPNYPKVVFLSIDETEGPRDALALRKRIIGPEKDKWSFLLSDKESIATLTKELDFKMRRDPVSGVITHEIGLYTLNNGELLKKMSRMQLDEKDLDFKVQSLGTLHEIKKFCSEFDPSKSKYGNLVMNLLTGMCMVFLAGALGGYLYLRKSA